MVTIENITKTYRGVDGKNISAIKNLSASFANNKITAIVGPNGCGKSTLLKIMAGLDSPTTGTIHFAKKSGRRIGLVPQQVKESLFPWHSVKEHVLAASIGEGNNRVDTGRVNRVIENLSLRPLCSKYPYELSGGQAQLVALARAFVYRPDIFLLDEPFAALDYHTSLAVQQKFLRLWYKEPKTTVIVTHTLEEAVLLAHHILVLAPGGLCVAEISVPLSHPRNIKQINTTEFRAIQSQIFKHLKGFLVCDNI